MLNNEASFPRYVEVQRTASAGISNVRIEEATSRRSSTTRRWVGGGEWAEVRVVPKMDGRGRRWFTCNLRLEKGKAKVDYVHKVRPARSLGCPPLRLGMEKEKQKHREKRNSRAPEAGASASWRLTQWPQVIGWAFHPNPTLPADVRGSYELFKRGGAGAAKGAMPPFQADHVGLADGGPTPSSWLLAGYLEGVARGLNASRAAARRRAPRAECALPRAERLWRNDLRRAF